jgi:heat shock protein HtpX
MGKDFYSQITVNKWKSYFLLFFFALFIILFAYVISIAFFPGFTITILILAFIFSIVYILIAFNSGDKMVLAATHAKEVKKKDDPFLVNTVEGLAIAAGIPKPKVYLIKEDSINAFAAGKDPKHASVTVTSGARHRLNRQELEGVIAHEISHVKNYDVRMMVLVAVLVGVIVLISDIMLRSFIWGGAGRRGGGEGGGQARLIMIVIAIGLAILAPIIAQLIKLAISRKREYLADANGALLTRYPPGLANALKKIRDDHDKVVDTANRGMAHLFIENPLRHTKRMFSGLFSTHPPINDRIKRLQSM